VVSSTLVTPIGWREKFIHRIFTLIFVSLYKHITIADQHRLDTNPYQLSNLFDNRIRSKIEASQNLKHVHYAGEKNLKSQTGERT
jgi:hypothetical protein